MFKAIMLSVSECICRVLHFTKICQIINVIYSDIILIINHLLFIASYNVKLLSDNFITDTCPCPRFTPLYDKMLTPVI